MEGEKNSSTPKHLILESNGNTYVVENVSQEKKGNSFMTHWKINKKQPFQFTNFSPTDFQTPPKKPTSKRDEKRKNSLPNKSHKNEIDNEKRYSMNFEQDNSKKIIHDQDKQDKRYSMNLDHFSFGSPPHYRNSPTSGSSSNSQSPATSPSLFKEDMSPRKRSIHEIEEIPM